MIHITERNIQRGEFTVIRRKTIWLFWVIPIYVRDYRVA